MVQKYMFNLKIEKIDHLKIAWAKEVKAYVVLQSYLQ